MKRLLMLFSLLVSLASASNGVSPTVAALRSSIHGISLNPRWTAWDTINRMFHGAFQILLPILGDTPAASGLAAPSVVQVKACSGTSTPNNCSLTSNATAGNLIVVLAFGNSGGCSSVTSTPSNTFQMWLPFSTGSSNKQSVFIAKNVASGTNSFVTTCTGANSFVSTVIYEVANAVGADVAGSISGTGSTPGPSVTSLMPTGTSTAEVIAWLTDNANFRNLVAGTGYTMQGETNKSGATSTSCTPASGQLCLTGSEDNTTKTGLSGTLTATMTGVSTDAWQMSIISVVNASGTQDAADTNIDFEGLSNTVKPTVAQLQSSTHGVPGIWTAPTSTVFTGATGSQGTTTPSPHQMGASSLTGSGSLGLAYATGTATNDLKWTLPRTSSTLSWIGQFKTSLPQGDTMNNAYTLTQMNDTAITDYAAPQLQANGTSLRMALECPSNNGSGTIAISTNVLYYLYVLASTNGGIDNLRIYDSSGTEITTAASGTVAPITCTSKTGTQTWDHITFGVNGAEPESAGSVISVDNVRISLTGATLTP